MVDLDPDADGLPNRFSSLLHICIKEDDGAVQLLNAGHMPPLLSDGNDTTGGGQTEAALAATRDIRIETRTIGLGAGDEVLVTEMEHHSNIVPWQMLCDDVGATLQVAPIDDRGEVILEEYEKLLNERTRLVAIGIVELVSVRTRRTSVPRGGGALWRMLRKPAPFS